jgi:undecaprenyl-diphosphatase
MTATASSSVIGPRLLPAERHRAVLAIGVLLVLLGLMLHASGLDPPWMLWAHRRAPSPAEEVAWSCLTIAGMGWSALILVLAADRGQGRLTALLLPTFVLGSLLTHVPKWLVPTPRPAATALLQQLHVIGDALRGPVSMPSGHALTAAATAVLLCAGIASGRRVLGTLIVAFAVLVCISRVAVGAHWPSDVLVGAGLGLVAPGLVFAAACRPRTARALERLAAAVRRTNGQRCVALVELAAAAGLVFERTGYPSGRAMVGLLAGTAIVSAAWRWRDAGRARTWTTTAGSS